MNVPQGKSCIPSESPEETGGPRSVLRQRLRNNAGSLVKNSGQQLSVMNDPDLADIMETSSNTHTALHDWRAAGNMRIVLNIGGQQFETFLFTILRYPHTRLAKELLYRNLQVNELFFDRDPLCFHPVLNYYRTGVLHVPLSLCGPLYQEELRFWEVDWNIVQPCCRNQLVVHHQVRELVRSITHGHSSVDLGQNEWNMAEEKRHFNENYEKNSVIKNVWSRFLLEMKQIWNLLENPSTETVRGKFVSFVPIMMIIMAILLLTAESMEFGRQSINPNFTVYELSEGPVDRFLEDTRPVPIISKLQLVEICYFSLELFIRFVFAPSKMFFLSKIINWIDFLAVGSVAMSKLVEFAMNNELPSAVHIFGKLPRIFRLFKLTLHMQELQVLIMALKASFKELRLLFIIVIMFTVVWGVTAYSIELMFEDDVFYGKNSQIRSVMSSYWWALVTMTTVGYGDIVVCTAGGYIVGAMCSLCGVLVIALPIPIVVNNFSLLYAHHQAMRSEKEAKHRKAEELSSTLDSTDEMNEAEARFDVLKEPKGFIKLLQLFMAIFAFATTCGYHGDFKWTVKCENNRTITNLFNISYPFDINGANPNVQLCGNSTSQNVTTHSIFGNFSASSQFYVFIGVMTMLACLAILAIYIFFYDIIASWEKVDFIVGGFVAVFWFVASIAWADGVTKLKYYSWPDEVFKYLKCSTAICAATTYPVFGSLNVSLILGFSNVALWIAGLWFVWKETPWFRGNKDPDFRNPSSTADGSNM